MFSDGALMRSALWLVCADVHGVWVRLESVVQVQGSPSRKVWGSNATSDLNQAEADHHIHSQTELCHCNEIQISHVTRFPI